MTRTSTVRTVEASQSVCCLCHYTDQNPGHEKIRINNFPALESIGPNRIFVSAAAGDAASADNSKPDEFTLDTSHLSKTSAAFTYRIHADESDAAETTAPSLAQHVPLILKPAWKPQGDKLGLLLQYRLNPASALPRPVQLTNVVFVATYESDRGAAGAQTKPSGTHLKEKRLVYWRVGDLALPGAGDDEWSKIVCRIVGAEGGEPRPGRVEARWEYVVPQAEAGAGSAAAATAAAEVGGGISVSRWVESKGKGKEEAAAAAVVLDDDPFADEGAPHRESPSGNWVGVPLAKKLVSGKYEAK
jgi:hypothetical protein